MGHDTISIYHNPRCSKSRQTLALLQEKGIEPRVIEYLKTPPDATELDELLTLLKLEPRDFMRKNETAYKENNLDDPALSRADLIDAMVKNPILIQRPIVFADGKIAIGRPPELVLDIL